MLITTIPVQNPNNGGPFPFVCPPRELSVTQAHLMLHKIWNKLIDDVGLSTSMKTKLNQKGLNFQDITYYYIVQVTFGHFFAN